MSHGLHLKYKNSESFSKASTKEEVKLVQQNIANGNSRKLQGTL